MTNPKLGHNLLRFIHINNYSPFTSHNFHHQFFRILSPSFINRPLPLSILGFHYTTSRFNLATAVNASSKDIHREKIGESGVAVLQNICWGEKALSIAKDVLLQFGDDIEIFGFKIYPAGRGYVYVRLHRLRNKFLSLEDIQSYSHEYKKKLDEAGAVGDFPSDLAVEVSSPDADRLLRLPDDLQRFKNMAMRVKYDDPKSIRKEGIFFLESIDKDSGSCVWRLADVKENRDPSCKGRPLTRKQKDWRLKLSYERLEQVTLYLGYH